MCKYNNLSGDGDAERTWATMKMAVLTRIRRHQKLRPFHHLPVDEQDYLSRWYGPAAQRKASWSEKAAALTTKLKDDLGTHLLMDVFMKTLCHWCNSPKVEEEGMVFVEAFIVYRHGKCHDHPEGTAPERNCYMVMDIK